MTEAREHYQKALAGFEANKDGAGAAAVLASLGNLYYSQSDHPAALDHYQKSLKQYETLGDRPGATGVLARIASVNYLQGLLPWKQSRRRTAPQIKRRRLTIKIRCGARARLKGAALRNLNEIERARSELESAIAVIERARTRLVGPDQEAQRFFQDKSSPYTAMIELLIAENRPEEAISYAERIKSHTLLDVIESGRVRVTAAMTAREQNYERRFNKQCHFAQLPRSRASVSGSAPDRPRLTKLNDAFEKSLYQYSSFKKRALRCAHLN